MNPYFFVQILKGKEGVNERAGETMEPLDLAATKEQLIDAHGMAIIT